MKRNQIFLVFLSVIILVFSCKKDVDSYERPYESGVYVDREGLESHKKMWEENKIKNYTYTYSYDLRMDKTAANSYSCYKIDVTVENEEVLKYVLKEYEGKTEQDVDSEVWNSYKESFDTYVLKKDSNFFLIENIYKRIDDNIEASFDALKENPETYYTEVGFEFTEDIPYLSSYYFYTVIMEEHLDGNSGCEEIKIENFTEN